MSAITPEQFLARVRKHPPAPAYLFLGPEGYYRRLCKEALVAQALNAESRAEGLTQIDLEETSLREILDDARSLSLFTPDRVIWVTSAELALPRRVVTTNVEEDEQPDKPTESELKEYLRSPTPGTVIVFECNRYDFAGDDRAKLERVQKFYSDVALTVEFRSLNSESSRFLAQELAKQYQLRLAGAELAVLLDAVAGDANRLAAEIEKLSLFVPPGEPVTMEHLRALVPNAQQATIFNLVNALGKSDRAGALRSLDILMREGEYLPLALTFLSAQFRLALAAKDARVSTSTQAQAFFTKLGVRIWRDRAEQVMATAGAFTRDRLAKAVGLIYETDKKFREGYKDDRIIMESLVLALTDAEAARR
ncbi:MAG: DNA polymerase III subunit delta [Acidobacteriaceae bacterium]|nr:DNA polymerase III subunit delta [Acidobacteriaceae bacterium]